MTQPGPNGRLKQKNVRGIPDVFHEQQETYLSLLKNFILSCQNTPLNNPDKCLELGVLISLYWYFY